jgi:hypothetical protein
MSQFSCFNPPVRGAICLAQRTHDHLVVSTHAPVRGATTTFLSFGIIIIVSTHAPVRGRDSYIVTHYK